MLVADGSTSGAADGAAFMAAKRPLRESQSGRNESSGRPRSSEEGDEVGNREGGKKLSEEEQDAVVAKIRSAAKQSASPEKKLPYQDDDTPNTKSAHLKKEMEVGSSGVRAFYAFVVSCAFGSVLFVVVVVVTCTTVLL